MKKFFLYNIKQLIKQQRKWAQDTPSGGTYLFFRKGGKEKPGEAGYSSGLSRDRSMTGFLVCAAGALPGQAGIAPNADMTGGASGIVGKGGGTVVAGAAIVAFVH